MVKGFEAQNAWKARDRGFQMGAIQPAGIVIHLTGQVAWDQNETIVGKGDVEEQTRQCLKNIESIVRGWGATRRYSCNHNLFYGSRTITSDSKC